MNVLPADLENLVRCFILAGCFEFLRIVIAYLIARPSTEVAKLEDDKDKLQIELKQIKSVQLEFVKHSLLSRKVIAIEKKIENLQIQYAPRALKVKRAFRIIRLVAYVAAGFALGGSPVVFINPQVLWPMSWFTAQETVGLSPWFTLFLLGGTFRHIWRTLLPIISPRISFP